MLSASALATTGMMRMSEQGFVSVPVSDAVAMLSSRGSLVGKASEQERLPLPLMQTSGQEELPLPLMLSARSLSSIGSLVGKTSEQERLPLPLMLSASAYAVAIEAGRTPNNNCH